MEIFISSSTKLILEELNKAMENKIKVEIRTKPIEASINQEAQTESLNYLAEKSLTVIHPRCDFLRFAVIDSSEVWFGDINLLGGAIKKNQAEETEQKIMMHIYSANAAESLINSTIGLL